MQQYIVSPQELQELKSTGKVVITSMSFTTPKIGECVAVKAGVFDTYEMAAVVEIDDDRQTRGVFFVLLALPKLLPRKAPQLLKQSGA